MIATLARRLISLITRYLILPVYTRVTVVGLENVPRSGPLIVVANHLNDGDPGLLLTRIPRRVVFMAKAELFNYPFLKQFMDLLAFPVHRNEADLKALRQAQEVLKEGLALGMFPEGRRSGGDARLGEAWPGAALVALRSGAPLLPVAITGSQRLALPGLFLHPFRRDRVLIRIGEPFGLDRPARIDSAAAKDGTDVIMAQIAALLPPEYRGYYGEERARDEGPDAPRA